MLSFSDHLFDVVNSMNDIQDILIEAKHLGDNYYQVSDTRGLRVGTSDVLLLWDREGFLSPPVPVMIGFPLCFKDSFLVYELYIGNGDTLGKVEIHLGFLKKGKRNRELLDMHWEACKKHFEEGKAGPCISHRVF
jgi:hypothetical protein